MIRIVVLKIKTSITHNDFSQLHPHHFYLNLILYIMIEAFCCLARKKICMSRFVMGFESNSKTHREEFEKRADHILFFQLKLWQQHFDDIAEKFIVNQ